MQICKYQLIDRQGVEGEHLYDDCQEAIREAGDSHAVQELQFEYSDSDLVYVPDGSGTWPPSSETRNPDMIDSEECGCCEFYHRHGFAGDCRDDSEGFLIVYGNDDEPPATHFDESGEGYASREAFGEKGE